jgi:TonB family protein
MTMKTAACILTALVMTGAALHAENSVSAARELYASAAYDDALKMLDGLQHGSLTVEERQAIGVYRALCYVALGRATDAEAAIEALVAQHPHYRPAMDDLPPRMRTAFTETRRRLLPALIQRQYADAKAAFDRKDYGPASEAFNRVLEALADSDVAVAANQPPLSDLKVLAMGFHDLSMKELELPALPPPAPVVLTAPVSTRPARDYTRTYGVDDKDVAQPGIVKQAFPPFRGRVAAAASGVIEVLIDTSGEVESATIVMPVHPLYDGVALDAAKRWRYQPAMLEGVPVKYIKRVQITLTPTP